MTRKGKYDDFIIANHQTMTALKMAEALGTWNKTIFDALKRLKLKALKARHSEERNEIDRYIRDNADTMTDNEMASKLNKSYHFVYTRRVAMGVNGCVGTKPVRSTELTYSQICSGLYCIITGYKIDKYA